MSRLQMFRVQLILFIGASFSECFESTHLKFGYALPSRQLRTITGISIGLCQIACRSRASCLAIQYRRFLSECMLMSEDSLTVTLVRNKNYIVSEKRFSTQPSISALCDSCNNDQVCTVTGPIHSCTREECQLLSPAMQDTTKNGNIMEVGSKVTFELQCYSISNGQLILSNNIYYCFEDGTWLKILGHDGDCYPSYESFINYMGCYRDKRSRVLSHNAGSNLDPLDMTLEKCAVYCFNKGYAYAGIEKGRECYCGNYINDHGPSAGCTFYCTGDSSLLCGGHWALQLYNYINV